MGSNSTGTIGPRHSKAQTEGWAYNRVPTVRNKKKQTHTVKGITVCFMTMLPWKSWAGENQPRLAGENQPRLAGENQPRLAGKDHDWEAFACASE